MVKVNLNNLKKTLTTNSKKESPNGYTLEWVISERGWGNGQISIYANDNYLGF